MKTGSTKVTKQVWYRAGGFANPACWRKQPRNGGWQYFILVGG